MGVTRKHTLYDCELGKATPLSLPGISSMELSSETEVVAEATSGALYPEHIAMTAQDPTANLSTFCIAKFLTEIALTGLSISTLPTGLNLFAYKHAEGSGRAGASSHRKYGIGEGIIVPVSLSCDHRGDCQLQYKVIATYDGTNAPVVITDTVTLPTAGNDDERFTIGKTVLGNITIDHLKSVSLDFGIEAEPDSADSDIWSTHVSIKQTKPVFTFRGVDVEYLKSSNIPLEGKASTHATTSVHFRKRSLDASGFVSDSTAEHVKITADGLAYVDKIFSAQESGGAAEATVMLPCRYDGTNSPLVISPAAQIT